MSGGRMAVASWIFVATLAYAQTGDQFANLPPAADTSTFFSSESSEVQGGSYPAFVLPQPTAPPPSPALAAEALPLPATRLTMGWLAPGGTHAFGMTDLDCNHT